MPAGAIPFPFGKCKICKDKATGVHYGVATCEGCKGFFKRSIPKAEKYKCFFGGHCEINIKNRNRCKSCRFKLCIQSGMSVDAVKMGRIPKTEKEKALAEAAANSCPQHENPFTPDLSSRNIPNAHIPHTYGMGEMHAGNPFSDTTKRNYIPMTVQRAEQEGFVEQSRIDCIEQVNTSQNSDSSSSPGDSSNQDYEDVQETEHNWRNLNDVTQLRCLAIPSSSVATASNGIESGGLNNSGEIHHNRHASPKSSHFSSAVIEELVKQVLQTPQETPHERTQSMSSVNLSVTGPLHGLAISDSSSDSEMMHIYDPSCVQSTKSDQLCINNSGQDIKQSLENSSHQINKYININCDKEKHSDTNVNLDLFISRSESGMQRSFERTAEETEESEHLIGQTLERILEGIRYLFSFQEHNRECYRKHMTGEENIRKTCTDKKELKFVWSELMKGVDRFNTQVMGFCSKVPGFSNFKKEDQEKLTLNVYMEIWMMINAEFMCHGESYVLLNNLDIFYSRDTMKVILGNELTTLMLEFGKKFCSYNLSDMEIGLLCAVRLTNPDVEDLIDKEKVELLNSHYLDIFASVFNKRPNSSRSSLSLFQYMSVLKTITALQQTAIFNFSIDSPPEDVFQASELGLPTSP